MADQVKAREADWIVSRGMPVYAVAHAKATVRGNSTVDADLARLEERAAGTGSFTVTNAVVNVDAWQESADGVSAVIPVTGVTDSTVPLIYVLPQSSDTATYCGLMGKCTASDGIVTINAQITPKDTIELTILAMFSQTIETDINVAAPSAPVLAYYKLPPATKDTIGGVKIGRNIVVDEDGTISAADTAVGCKHVLSGAAGPGPGDSHHVHDEECMKDLLATTDEVEDALNRALGIDDTD